MLKCLRELREPLSVLREWKTDKVSSPEKFIQFTGSPAADVADSGGQPSGKCFFIQRFESAGIIAVPPEFPDDGDD